MSRQFIEQVSIIGLLVGLGWLTVTVTRPLTEKGRSDVTVTRLPHTQVLANSQTAGATEQQAQTANHTLFLPLVVNNYCGSFAYSETLDYNLEVINVADVWACNRGRGVTVAVVDSGVDLDHPELVANLTLGETFVSGTDSPNDDNGHGTHVAGIIAATANNGGVIGVAPETRIMPVKVLDSAGSGSLYDVADGIRWATDNGAQVINLSLGTVSNSSTLEEAVEYAVNNGVLLISSAGNCGDGAYRRNGCSYQDQPSYPAALSDVVAVASTDEFNNQSSFSNQGSCVELAAPGSDIYSTYPENEYETLSGTSMAAPHVAGVAALVWAHYPGWNSDQIRRQLRETAADLGSSGWDSRFGYGLVNAGEAIKTAHAHAVVAPSSNVTLTAPEPDQTNTEFITGEILLKLKPGFMLRDVLDTLNDKTGEIRVRGSIDNIGIHKLSVPAGQEAHFVEQLRRSSGIAFAEPNYTIRSYAVEKN
jgi:type VII secretion-associated serine protease mycosin